MIPTVALLLTSFGCSLEHGGSASSTPTQRLVPGSEQPLAGDSLHNILLVVLDDWGNDAWGGGVGRDLPHTPTLDALARSGVVFRKMWVNPVCCSSRAELLTGRYSFRTGIGRILDKRDPDEFELEPEEFTLPELFKAGLGDRYGLAAFGKWHLSRDPQSPNQQGFDHYSGCLWNLRDYRDCALTTNGVTRRSTVYATTQTANDAIAWIHANQAESFFVYLSFHAPHVPIHVPPQGLHHQGVLTDSKGANERRSWKAAIEGVDTELGRLLDSLPRAVRDDTMIFVTGDNGTTDRVILPPWKPTRGKGSVYQEGIGVPLIVSGPLVTRPGSQSDVLVDGTDFFATFAEIARIPLSTALPPGTVLDSVSFLPSIVDPALASGRSYSLAEHFQPNGRGEGHPKPTPPLPYYQPELMQYQGPGTTHLAVGTEYLDLGNRADAFLTLAPPNAYVELYVWEQQAATSKFGGTLASSGAPSRTLTGFTDSSGALSWVDALVVDMEDFQQPHSWYVQSRIDDPSQAGGYQLSNAVNVRFNEASNIKAIRNQCWALVVSMNGNPQHEELYDLCTDPFQQIDYLKSGPLTPGTKEHANYVALRAKLTSWLQ